MPTYRHPRLKMLFFLDDDNANDGDDGDDNANDALDMKIKALKVEAEAHAERAKALEKQAKTLS